MAEVVIRFGSDEAEYLTLTVHGRNRPQDTDYWGGNFLWCTAEVSAGAFRGLVSNVLRNEDLARFLSWLEAQFQRLDGEALLDTLDGWLDVRVICAARGQVEVRGQLCDAPLGGNTLEFRLTFDQTYLPPMIAQVRAAVEAFPVVGEKPGEPGAHMGGHVSPG
jgi:hypothetical protein